MAAKTIRRKLSTEEFVEVDQDQFALRIHVEFGPAFGMRPGLTLAQWRDHLLAESAKRPRSFIGGMLAHFAEHIDATATELAKATPGKREDHLTRPAPSTILTTYYGHDSCGPDRCICKDGDDVWCEDC